MKIALAISGVIILCLSVTIFQLLPHEASTIPAREYLNLKSAEASLEEYAKQEEGVFFWTHRSLPDNPGQSNGHNRYGIVFPTTTPTLQLVRTKAIGVASELGANIELNRDPMPDKTDEGSPPRYSGSSGRNLRYVGAGWVKNTMVLLEAFAVYEAPPFNRYKILDDNPKMPEGSKFIVVQVDFVWQADKRANN